MQITSQIYNQNNPKFKAAAPKPPVYKRMLTGYENFESKSKNSVREFLRDRLGSWDVGGEIVGGVLFIMAMIGVLVCIIRSNPVPKRVNVEDTKEYRQQYKTTNELYDAKIFIGGEYEARLNKLLPKYDSLIQDTKNKMDNVVQLRIMRSNTDFPKDPVTGKYKYSVRLYDGKASVDVKIE